MTFSRIYDVEESKLSVWFYALTSVFFDVDFNVSRKHLVVKGNRVSPVNVRGIQVIVNDLDQFGFIENYISQICYSKGYIQNLTKKENLHVRKADRQVPEKVCPSTGETCKHDNGSGNCVCEGAGERFVSESCNFGFDSLPDVREKGRIIANEYLKEIESELNID